VRWPCIVPVYGLGHYGNGRPFYAMRFVKGDNLKQAVQEFHDADRNSAREPSERSLALRRLLGRFVDVCNAVAYAHSRGVLHRDLKPGNVLLGPFGETLVVDWGLAKVVGRPESAVRADEPTLRPASGSGVETTLPNAALGTPGYMSPEQAAGELARLGTHSDVYSLGATLYYVLTGQSAFLDNDVSAALAKTRRGEFPPPCAVAPAVPRPLEAICLKAMALQPEDRYPSPRALADDIEHWLADESVSAWRERRRDRLARWARRHRVWVQAGVAALMLTSVISVAAALLVNQARRTAEEQRRAAERQRRTAVEERLRAEQQRRKVQVLTSDLTTAYNRVQSERDKASQFASSLALEEARKLRTRGEADAGLLWLASALELLPSDEQSGSQRAIRQILAPYRHTSGLTLKAVFRVDVDLGPKARRDPSTPLNSNPIPLALDAGGHTVVIGSGNTARLWSTADGTSPGQPLTHDGAISAVAFSPDGKTILTGSADKTARLWSASDGQPAGAPMIHGEGVTAVAFSPDGHTILTASGLTARLWSDGAAQVMTHDFPVTAAVFSPDGRTVLTASGQTARLWSAANGHAIGRPMTHQGTIAAAAFSADGTAVVTAQASGKTGWEPLFWNAADGTPQADDRHRSSLWRFASQRTIECLAMSRDGGTTLAVAEAGVARLVGSAGANSWGWKTLVSKGAVLAGVFSPDGDAVLTLSDDRTARLWNGIKTRSSNPLRRILVPAPNATGGVTLGNETVLAVRMEGRRALTRGRDETVRVWDLAGEERVGLPLPGDVGLRGGILSYDGRTILTVGQEGAGQVWNFSDGQRVGEAMIHQGPVRSVAFSPDGRAILTSDATFARLWDVTDGRPIGQPLAHPVRVSSASFSPDGTTVLTAGDDKKARLWSAAEGRAVGQPMIHQGSIGNQTFSADGKTILTLDGSTARLWSTADGSAIGAPLTHTGQIDAAVFSPDGQTVATGSRDKTARLWNAADSRPIGQPMLHENFVSIVAFSPDGKTVLTAGPGHSARLWGATDGKPVGEPMTHQSAVASARFSPDGNTILTHEETTAQLWSAADGRPIGRPMAHPSRIDSVSLSADGKTMLTRARTTVRLWSAADGQLIGQPMTHDHATQTPRFSPDGKTLMTCGENTVRLWGAADGKPIGGPLIHQAAVRTTGFSPDGRFVVTSEESTVRLWSAADGSSAGRPMTQQGAITDVRFSPDGKAIHVTSAKDKAQLWDAATRKPIGRPMMHERAITRWAFSPDSKIVYTAVENTAQLWHALDGTPLGQPMIHERPIKGHAFSRDGKTILTRDDTSARLWSAAAGHPIGAPMTHEGSIAASAFSPDGRTYLSAGDDGTARLWSTADGKAMGRPMPHQGPVAAATFSPDNRIVLTRSGPTAQLWSAATGEPIGPPMNHEGTLTAAGFSPDGQTICTASADRTARLWRATDARPIGRPMVHGGPVANFAFSPDGRTILSHSSQTSGLAHFYFWSAADGSSIGEEQYGTLASSSRTTITFYDNSKSSLIYNDQIVIDIRLPSPLEGSPRRLRRWAEVITGMELRDDNVVHILDPAQWQERRRELDALGGPPPL
jgi:WD40 repeat protein